MMDVIVYYVVVVFLFVFCVLFFVWRCFHRDRIEKGVQIDKKGLR